MAMYSGTTKAEVLRFQSAFRLMHGASNSITQQSFFTSGGERLTIVSGGNVGIGTASPGAKLHVAGPHADEGADRAATTALIVDTKTDGTGDGKTYIKTGWVNTGNYGVSTLGVGYYAAGSQVRDVITMLGTGRVGVGTTTPTQRLHLNGGVLRISGGGASSNGEINLDSGTEYDGWQVRKESSTMWGVKSVTSGNDLAIFVDNTTARGVYIKTGGNVGVGTTDPQTNFHVVGTANTIVSRIGASGQYLTIGSYTPNSAGATLGYNGTQYLGLNAFFGVLVGRTYVSNNTTAPADGMIIQGNLGVGATSPSDKLHVVGNTLVTGGVYNIEGTTVRVLNPGGAALNDPAAPVTGAFKIKLPVAAYNSNTMMTLVVDIYNYDTGKSLRFRIGGYNYQDGSWYNTFAEQTSDLGVAAYNVRFGNDGTSNCIWIGETNSTWQYPKVFVSQFLGAHAATTSAWASGWTISRVTSFDTVTATRNASVGINNNNIGTYGVSSITGTANQVTASASTGAVTLSLPQNIHTAATPTFSSLTLSGDVLTLSGSGVAAYSTNAARIYNQSSVGVTVNTNTFEVRTGTSNASLALTINNSQHSLFAGRVGSGVFPGYSTAQLPQYSMVAAYGTDVTSYAATGTTRAPDGYTIAVGPFNNTNRYSQIVFGAGNGSVNGFSYIGGAAHGTSYLAHLIFGRTTGSASYAESMRIDGSSGNVLIGGTADNGHKLEVTGNALVTKLFVGTANASYDLYNNGTTYLNGAVNTGGTLTVGSTLAVSGTGTSTFGGDATFNKNGNIQVTLSTASTTAGATNRLRFITPASTADVRSGVIEWFKDGSTFMGDLRFKVAGGIEIRNSADQLSFTTDDSKNATVYGNLTVSGNLIINGTTTTVNSTTTTLDDPIITLGGDTAPTVDDNKDRGVEFRWHNGTAAKVGFFGYDDSTGYFTFIPDATNSSEVFSGTQGDIQATNFRGTFVGSLSNALTAGSYLTGGSYNGSAAVTFAVDATSANTASKVVARDSSGNFSAGTITATLSGNASTASDSSLLNGISAVNLYNNMGEAHGTRTSFDATTPSYGFGYRFVQGSTNGPGTGGSQYYSWYIGLGSQYPSTGAGSYGAMFALDRSSSTPYLSVRFNEANSFSSWYKIRAGAADTWSTARNFTIGSTARSVNGSADVTWTLADIGAAAASHNHTSLTSVTSIGFATEASDSASISATISGTQTFFDFNLTDDNNNDLWRWRFTPSGSTVYNAMTLSPSANGVSDLVVAGTITGTRLISNVATGTAPLTVASTTLVTNLNADLLDGLNSATGNTASTIVARDSSGNFSAGTITSTSISTTSGGSNGVRVHTNSGITASNNYMNFFTSQTSGWAFNANGTGADTNTLVVIDAAGDLGIGTTNPVYRLQLGTHFSGTQAETSMFINAGGQAVAGAIFISPDGNSSVGAKIGQYFESPANIQRLDLGTVGYSGVYPTISIEEGKVGIGTTAPQRKLDILGGDIMVRSTSDTGTSVVNFGSTTYYPRASIRSTGLASPVGDANLSFWTRNSGTEYERITILNNGNVGIGVVSPSAVFDISGNSVQDVGLVRFVNGSTSGTFVPTASFVQTRGNHSFGIVAEFRTNTAGDTDRPTILFRGAQAAHQWRVGQVTNGWGTNDNFGIGYVASNASPAAWPTNYFTITTGGNVGIGVGTSAPGYKLEVNGSFAATTKSFVIKHPTKEGKKLRYGSLEGPENGVYVRGKLKGSNIIELPDYWTKLVDPESITVQLTPIGSHQKLYVEKIEDNKVYIVNENLLAKAINCFFYVLAERCDVEKLEVEIDA
jgi:hypothetical protein